MPSKPRLLIVEDEAAIRAGLEDVFVYHGYAVDTAAEGREGLRKALSGRFDLILLDVMLPGVDGFSICERIRAVDREQPIILLTAKTSDEDIVRGLRLGADDYVGKPFSVTQLVARVEAVLRRARLASDPQRIRLGEGIEVDVANLTARRGAETIAFTRREMDVLQYLGANPERAVS
nr:response regulator transcription factor [Rubritepida sp.]